MLRLAKGAAADNGTLGDMSRTRRRMFIVTLIVVAVAAVTWVLWPSGRRFDPVLWNDKTEVERGIRLAMADRIVARRMLSGKTRAEVIAMLGEPRKTDYFSDWDLVYWLGRERGFISIDSEWLVVRFDANKRVLEYRIVRD
jgi:outer membrane protein assembly factor BamE (lipoprotein component of BamABCDE complex)